MKKTYTSGTCQACFVGAAQFEVCVMDTAEGSCDPEKLKRRICWICAGRIVTLIQRWEKTERSAAALDCEAAASLAAGTEL